MSLVVVSRSHVVEAARAVLDAVDREGAALRAAAVGEEPRQRETAADADAAAYRDAARAVSEDTPE